MRSQQELEGILDQYDLKHAKRGGLKGRLVEMSTLKNGGSFPTNDDATYIDARWPPRCQGCVPYVNCLWITGDEDTEIDVCPRGAQAIAMDVMDAASYLRDCEVNLNDRAAVKALLLANSEVEEIDRAIKGGRLDNLIDRAVECASRD
jgi:hypothetical protein